MALKYAILGLLANFGSQSGYDLKTRFERGPNQVWTADLSQIYRTFSKLVDESLVTVKDDPDSGRGRKVYTITDAGQKALQEWLEADFTPSTFRDPFLLKLFFNKYIPPQRLAEQIEQYREYAQQRQKMVQEAHQRLQEYAKINPDDAFRIGIGVDLGLRVMNEYVVWCDAILAELEARYNEE